MRTSGVNVPVAERPSAPGRKVDPSGSGFVGKEAITAWDLLAFLIPTLQFVQVSLGGQLLGTELALLLLLPFLVVMRGRRLFQGLPRTYLLLGGLWLVSQIATDLLRDTSVEDYTRGWAKIVIALAAFSALYLLVAGHRRRIVLFAAGFVVGGILTYYINPHIYAEFYRWKFGLGIPLTLALVLLSAAVNIRGLKLLAVGVLAFGTLINFYLDFRSLGAIMALTTAYAILQAFMGRRGRRVTAVRPRQVILLGLIVLAASFATIKGYEYAARQGLLGETAQMKYEMQAGGEYGLLLGGRSEILVSSRAIWDSPFIGHGSWAEDCRYTNLLTQLKNDLGYFLGVPKTCLIPAHSHIFGSWVEAGVLGAVFWLWVFGLSVRVLLRLYQSNERLAPVVAFFAFFLLWDLLFSPFGAELRYRTPFEVVVMMMFLPVALRKGRASPKSDKNVVRPAARV